MRLNWTGLAKRLEIPCYGIRRVLSITAGPSPKGLHVASVDDVDRKSKRLSHR
jgi:hypothetical protein